MHKRKYARNFLREQVRNTCLLFITNIDKYRLFLQNVMYLVNFIINRLMLKDNTKIELQY